MGGSSKQSHGDAHGHGHGDAHGHGHGHGHGHDHHHAAPRLDNSIIRYEIPEAGHHVEDFKSPDWRSYKVENAPELVRLQKRLADVGLKDPWIRNEVWRFDPGSGSVPTRQLFRMHFSSGIKVGFALFVGTVLLETGYKKLFGSKDAHGHGHGHAVHH